MRRIKEIFEEYQEVRLKQMSPQDLLDEMQRGGMLDRAYSDMFRFFEKMMDITTTDEDLNRTLIASMDMQYDLLNEAHKVYNKLYREVKHKVG